MSTSITVELPDVDHETSTGVRYFPAGSAKVRSYPSIWTRPITASVELSSEGPSVEIELHLSAEEAMALGLALIAAAGDAADRGAEPADPLVHVKVGDPDPEAELISDEYCGARKHEVDPHDWTCTRPAGHPGQHIATDGVLTTAAWPAAQRPVPNSSGERIA